MISNEILFMAEYKIALMENTVTDEIRDNFYAVLNDKSTDSYFKLFEFILNSALTHMQNHTLTSIEAINFIQQEYINTPLESYIINYSEIKEFIENLIIDYPDENKIINKNEIIDKYLSLSENLPIDIYLTVRYTLLNYLVNGLPFDQENIELAQKIMEEIKLVPAEERTNSNALSGVLEQIFAV